MGHVILIWRMFNTPFVFMLYKLQMMKVFLFSSQYYDIIASGVILNPNILGDCMASRCPLTPLCHTFLVSKLHFNAHTTTLMPISHLLSHPVTLTGSLQPTQF